MKKVIIFWAMLALSFSVSAEYSELHKKRFARQWAKVQSLGIPEHRFGDYYEVIASEGGRAAITYLGRAAADTYIAQFLVANHGAQSISNTLNAYYGTAAKTKIENQRTAARAARQSSARNKAAPCVAEPSRSDCDNLRGYSRTFWLEAKIQKDRKAKHDAQQDAIDDLAVKMNSGVNTASTALQRADQAIAGYQAAQNTANSASNDLALDDAISNGVNSRLRAIARRYGNHSSIEYSGRHESWDYGAQVIIYNNGGQVRVRGRDKTWGDVYNGPVFVGGKQFLAAWEGKHHTKIYVNLEDNVIRYEECRSYCSSSVGGPTYRVK